MCKEMLGHKTVGNSRMAIFEVGMGVYQLEEKAKAGGVSMYGYEATLILNPYMEYNDVLQKVLADNPHLEKYLLDGSEE